MVYLCKAKFLTREVTNLNQHAQRGWFFGILFGLLLQFLQLKENFEKEAKSKGTPDASTTQVAILKERNSLYLKIIGGFGDMPVAANGFNLTQAIFGWQFSDGVLGAGGLISAIIGGYQLL